MSKTYDVEVYREAGWWMVAIPALGGLTQARRVADAEEAAREWITLDQDLAPSSVDVRVRSVVVDELDVTRERQRIDEWRDREREAHAEHVEAVAETLRRLSGHGVPVRDAGALLDISPQRVSQITSADKANARGAAG